VKTPPVKMRALKGVNGKVKGEEFLLPRREAALFERLGMAEQVKDLQTYAAADVGSSPMNRQMTAAPVVKQVPAVTPIGDDDADDLRATNDARMLAREHGIDLGTVVGTGKDGRILKCDIVAMLPQ
jgi:pyruvate/2-oxoglutarate dehydrogenase complex dihydrolipoamide acyltransferase (E2) component